jgi:glutaredoxin
MTLYVRTDCHLCAAAEALLRRLQCGVEIVDVDSSPVLQSRYGDAVPVLVAAGRVLLSGNIHEHAARKALGLAR